MQESAIALGINLRALVEAEDGSTGQVTVDKSVGEPGSWEDVAALIEGADVLTFEHEHVPDPVLRQASSRVSVQPPADALRYAQDKLAMRERLGAMGVPCPACGRGVMLKRKGKHGDFWGCSAFPQCRMTANDAGGKPDFTGKRMPRSAAGTSGARPSASPAPTYTPRGSYTPTADEQAEMDALFFGD